MADLISEIQGANWLGDKYGDNVLRFKFDWRDTRILAWINNFARITRENTIGDVDRQGIGDYDKNRKRKSTHQLRRSLKWRAWQPIPVRVTEGTVPTVRFVTLRPALDSGACMRYLADEKEGRRKNRLH